MNLNRRHCLGAAALLVTGCGAPNLRELTPQEMPPQAQREFRGAWVATVAHIDWPSAPALPGGDMPFPDEASWRRAQAAGNTLTRDDWRRANVDHFVRTLYERVHAVKPWLRVGVSPFGLPRTERRPPGIRGFDPYARLYADAGRWLAEGWLDYVAPQLYWSLENAGQSFAVLLDAWARDNLRSRHLWPGLFTSSVARPPSHWPADEILNQIALLRSQAARAGGHIHFSMAALLDDRDGIGARLQASSQGHAGAALVPATPWLGATLPPAPTLSRQQDHVVVAAAPGEPAQWFELWRRRPGAWHLELQPAGEPARLALGDGPLAAVVASSISRTGIQSLRVALRLMAHD